VFLLIFSLVLTFFYSWTIVKRQCACILCIVAAIEITDDDAQSINQSVKLVYSAPES